MFFCVDIDSKAFFSVHESKPYHKNNTHFTLTNTQTTSKYYYPYINTPSHFLTTHEQQKMYIVHTNTYTDTHNNNKIILILIIKKLYSEVYFFNLLNINCYIFLPPILSLSLLCNGFVSMLPLYSLFASVPFSISLFHYRSRFSLSLSPVLSTIYLFILHSDK